MLAATPAGAALVGGERFARSSELRRRVESLSPADRGALDAALPVLEALARRRRVLRPSGVCTQQGRVLIMGLALSVGE